MKIFDFYGMAFTDGDDALRLVADVFQVKFETRESSYWGEYYCASVGDFGGFRIIRNFFDGEWREEDHKNFAWLLEVNDVENQNDIFKRIIDFSAQIFFLHRSEVETKKSIKKFEYRDGNFILVGSSEFRGNSSVIWLTR